MYRGTIRNRRIELEDGPDLPEGTPVRFELIEKPVADAPDGRAKLRALAGVIDDLPSDLARNHDHYLHGATVR